MYPKSIQNLIECFRKLPGIGEKTAERLALASLEMEEDTISKFAQSLIDSHTKIKRCKICNHLTESEVCEICSNKNRNQSLICVVEEPKNVILFEKVGSYNGVYHVLGGLISPLDGVGPDDIEINSLIKRVQEKDIQEVIIAVKPSIEGETTTLYISKLLKDKNVIVSKIAHGVPLGSDMEYIDFLTLELALSERKNISD